MTNTIRRPDMDKTTVSKSLKNRPTTLKLEYPEICLVSKRMFIPDGTPVLVTEYYILMRRNIETLNMVVCSATNVEFCLCRRARRELKRDS